MNKLIRVNGDKRLANSYNDISASLLRGVIDNYNYQKEEMLVSKILNESLIEANNKLHYHDETVGTNPDYDLNYVEKRLTDLGFNVLIKDERNIIGKSIAQITIAW